MFKLIPLFGIKRLLESRFVSIKLTAEGKEIPKRKVFENRITLIGTDNTISITDLQNAQNLSVRRELKLVKIQDVDSKTRRPVYKLMTNADYHEEELRKRKERQISHHNSSKGDKLINLSSRIGEHDLMTGVKKMIKLLEKQYEVRVNISTEGEAGAQNSERIYSVIENNIKKVGKVVQKRNKGTNLKFQLVPIRDSSSQASDSSSDQSKDNKGPL